MSTVIRVPSSGVAPIPPFECVLPSEWVVAEAPGVLATCSPAVDPSVSVLISAVRVDRDVDLRSVAVRSLAQQRRAHPDVRLDSQRVGRFGDRLTYLRSVTVPGGEPRSQLHALFFAPSAPERLVADVFSIVATCPIARLDDLGAPFIDLVASFRFGEAAA